MPYNRAQLIGQARQLLNDATPLFWTDAELGDWIDQAALDISTKGRCVEAVMVIGLSPGIAAYAQPGGSIGIEAVLDADGKALAQLRGRQFGHVSAGNDTRPSSYAPYAGFLFFFPIPAEAMNVSVLYWLTTSQVHVLPEGYHTLVLLYALRMARMKEQRYAEAAQLNSMYLAELQFQRNDLQDREPDTKEKLRLADRIVRGP
jgi:hypothetical protein